MRDYGDEDDSSTARLIARSIATIRLRIGRVAVYYPARRLPTLPDHDAGDEEPRLALAEFDP